MRVDAAFVGDTNAESLGHLKVAMGVREAPPWHHGVNPSGPLSVRVDPLNPTLEELWDGQIEIEVLGPRGRAVKCETSRCFTGARRNRRPASSGDWSCPSLRASGGAISRTTSGRKRRCREGMMAPTLAGCISQPTNWGRLTSSCAKESLLPSGGLLAGKRNRKPIVQLIDDSGRTEVPRVSHYTLEKPAAEVNLDFAGEYEVSAPGGLYLARQGSFSAGYHSRAAKTSVVRRLDKLSGHPKPTKISADRPRSCGSGPQMG